eukprot:g6200.t1
MDAPVVAALKLPIHSAYSKIRKLGASFPTALRHEIVSAIAINSAAGTSDTAELYLTSKGHQKRSELDNLHIKSTKRRLLSTPAAKKESDTSWMPPTPGAPQSGWHGRGISGDPNVVPPAAVQYGAKLQHLAIMGPAVSYPQGQAGLVAPSNTSQSLTIPSTGSAYEQTGSNFSVAQPAAQVVQALVPQTQQVRDNHNRLAFMPVHVGVLYPSAGATTAVDDQIPQLPGSGVVTVRIPSQTQDLRTRAIGVP